jgi:hypothetical protein
MREICKSGSMRGMWKRSHGRALQAPPDERGGNSYARPNTTAPHPDSTNFGLRIRNSTNDRSGAITLLVEIAAITSDGSMQTLLGRQPRIPSASTKSSRSAVWRIQGKGDLHLCSGSAVWRE